MQIVNDINKYVKGAEIKAASADDKTKLLLGETAQA